MDFLALVALLKQNPDKAVGVIINLYRNGYYTDFTDYLDLCNYLGDGGIYLNKNLESMVSQIISLDFDKEKDKSIKKAKAIIDEYRKAIIDILYERTDKTIKRSEYERYLYLLLGQSEAALLEYEDLAFDYDGYKIQTQEERIYDSVNAIIHYLNDEISLEANYSPETLSLTEATLDEVVEALNNKDENLARKKLVSLQLYLGIGTKFRLELKRFILGSISVKEFLLPDDDLDKGRSK